jgi:hypothetical protein
MPSWPARRSVSLASALSMWRRDLHARGGIHKPERPSTSQQQGSAVPRRQGRQGRPQSADCEGSSPEEGCTTKEIRGAEIKVLSMCGSARTAASALAIPCGASSGISCDQDSPATRRNPASRRHRRGHGGPAGRVPATDAARRRGDDHRHGFLPSSRRPWPAGHPASAFDASGITMR